MTNLPYKKARMLRFWDSKTISYQPQYYDYDNYGKSLSDSLLEFIQSGLLRLSTPYENLDRALVADMKEFLKQKGGKTTGSKNELQSRILNSYDESTIGQFFNNSVYILTQDGKNAIEHNSIYFKNDAGNYGLTMFELKQLKDNNSNLSDVQILTIALNKKMSQSFQQCKWNAYSNTLKNIYCLKIENEDYIEAVLYIWLDTQFHLSGVNQMSFTFEETKTYINKFHSLSLPSYITSAIDECINNTEWSMNELRTFIIQNCFPTTPVLPFEYFSKEIVLDILCDQLSGNEFSPLTCQYAHNAPVTDSDKYYYSED